MADRYNHPDSVKARTIRLRGKKLVGPVSEVPHPSGQIKAGSYDKKKRKKYEKMLEEAGE